MCMNNLFLLGLFKSGLEYGCEKSVLALDYVCDIWMFGNVVSFHSSWNLREEFHLLCDYLCEVWSLFVFLRLITSESKFQKPLWSFKKPLQSIKLPAIM